MKKTVFRISALLVTAVLSLSIFSCLGSKKKYSFTYMTVFDTETVISGYDTSEKSFRKKADEIMEILTEYHRLFDIYNEYSGINNLATVNLAAGKSAVKVDEKITELIEFSKQMYDLTEGKTNIAMGSVTKIWHDYREEGRSLPPKELLLSAAQHTDISRVICNKNDGTVYLADGEMSLDVGAVAKGFATERAAREAEKRGFTSIALSVGGNVRTIGEKPNGEPWVTGIQNPGTDSPEPILLTVKLTDAACVTSGSYQRYYEVDGVRYHHIINPETLFPENTYLSVSVKCADSGVADALSTALFNMSEEKGREILAAAEADGAWIYPDGTVTKTQGFE